jgi:hypothetical protein
MNAQKLDFLGMNNISFQMKANELKNKVAILDSTSIYKDTAQYIQSTRCVSYKVSTEKLQLNNFLCNSIQYQFCDKKLEYIFINVSGEVEIKKALNELNKRFKKMGCKGKPMVACTQIDTKSKGIRIIINIDPKSSSMNFVLIPI